MSYGRLVAATPRAGRLAAPPPPARTLRSLQGGRRGGGAILVRPLVAGLASWDQHRPRIMFPTEERAATPRASPARVVTIKDVAGAFRVGGGLEEGNVCSLLHYVPSVREDVFQFFVFG